MDTQASHLFSLRQHADKFCSKPEHTTRAIFASYGGTLLAMSGAEIVWEMSRSIATQCRWKTQIESSAYDRRAALV